MSFERVCGETEPTLKCTRDPQQGVPRAALPRSSSDEGTIPKVKIEVKQDNDCLVTTKASDDAVSIAGSHCLSVTSHHSVQCKSDALLDVKSATTNSHSHSGGGSVLSGSGGRGGGKESVVMFPELDTLRFRNNFLQTVEELKMRRDVDVKKEKRIRELVEEKHQLQLKCDEIERGYAEHLDQCSHSKEEIKARFTSQIRQFEEDKARQACLEESRHKEMKLLKDEIRALQLAKYNLEKKVEEQERQLQVQTLARESILSELGGVEGKYQAIMSQVTSTSEQMAQLEANVKEAVELNRRLQYVNEHQKCVLAGYKTELEACRQELVEARASLAESLAERGERGQGTGRNTTVQELKMHTELNKQLESQLSSVREEHRTVLGRLKEAHTLLDKSIETSNAAQEKEAQVLTHISMLREETAKLQEDKERLGTDLTALQQQLTSQRQELSTDIDHWKAKTADVEQRLKSLQNDYADLQNVNDQLEMDGAARESELKTELARLVEKEEPRKEEQQNEEGKEREVELQKRVLELEQALRQQMEKVKNFMDKDVHVPSLPLSSGQAYSSNGEVPSPPKSLLLSPKVISDSNSTSPSVDVQTTAISEVKTSALKKLPSPRLHLERIHLPLKTNDDKCLEETSSSKRKGDQQSLPSDNISPMKKQKLLTSNTTPDDDVKVLSDQGTLEIKTSATGATTDTQSQPERMPDAHSFLPLSQPSYSSCCRVYEHQSLSQSSSDCQHTKGSAPWRIKLPESFYMNKKSNTELTPSAPIGRGKEIEQAVFTGPTDSVIQTEQAQNKVIHSLSTPSLHHNLQWNITKTQPSGTSPTKAIEVYCNFLPSMPAKMVSTSPTAETVSSMQVNNILPVMPPNTPLKTQLTSTAPCLPEQQNKCDSDTYNMHVESTTDQSVPNSPKSKNNFAIVFSDGEDEREDGGGSGELLSSQMNRKIKKVTTFLKMDRLRRTKVPKL